MQRLLAFDDGRRRAVQPFTCQLLKWIGSKQRFAHEIVSYFPDGFGRYFEPFLGSGAVLGTLAPKRALGSDAFRPLMEIWGKLHEDPDALKQAYAARWHRLVNGEKVSEYEQLKADYNARPNGDDLLVLCRSCYGGVVRFRKADGYMSTPCGAHRPISPASFARRADEWLQRTRHVEFAAMDFREALNLAKRGDLVYCDPPYQDTQRILYRAQEFSLRDLFEEIRRCKSRGVFVALSIDGTKRSGNRFCSVDAPEGLFEREVFVNCGRSMLRRFQMAGQSLESEVVADRLMLTY
jgi:DNA adenine methylase